MGSDIGFWLLVVVVILVLLYCWGGGIVYFFFVAPPQFGAVSYLIGGVFLLVGLVVGLVVYAIGKGSWWK